MAFMRRLNHTTQMAKPGVETKQAREASIADLVKIAGMNEAFTKKPRNVVYADSSQVTLRLQKKQNALFVFLKKTRTEPKTPLHSVLFAASPPELRAVTEIFEGELRYCHKSRPGEILRLPMEVMRDPFHLNWCLDDTKHAETATTQPMPNMTRELVVLWTENIRSDTLAFKAKTPNGDEITAYHTTLNKPDGSKEQTVSMSIKPAASNLPN